MDGVLTGVVIAGTAHLVNLVDVGPGVAVGSVLLLLGASGLPGAVGPMAAAAVLAPADLGEHAMLGDTGAHGLGAALGVALARRCGRPGGRFVGRSSGRTGRVALAAGLVASASNGERISSVARRASGVLRRAAGVAGAPGR
ncbi:hypothetical protein [Streptomyces microflavus]|uniref:hypothetical protein n=1 Tax=Streptomyces microflavus TaxID=1919 RepID=UPI0036CA4FE2